MMPLPAPHGHKYKAMDGSNKYIQVFCTPRNKTFILNCEEGLKLKICSKTILGDTCGMMKYKEFFDKMVYQKENIISDRKYHALFKTDTLKLTNSLTGERIYFEPVVE